MANFGASAVSGESTDIERGTAGGAIAHGDVVFKSATTGQWAAAQSDDTSTLGQAGIKKDMGVALNAAIADGPVTVLLRGDLTGCSSLLGGQVYVVSDAAAGSIIAHSALTEDTDYACVVGLAYSTTAAYINPINAGVVVNLA